jgi:hypothetical protein
MLIVGSVTPNRAVKLSFSPRSDANSADPSTQSITIGDGTLLGDGADAEFLMQMTTGTPSISLTHWARMPPVTPAAAEWASLPGYPTTGIPDLTGLQTSIVYRSRSSVVPVDRLGWPCDNWSFPIHFSTLEGSI